MSFLTKLFGKGKKSSSTALKDADGPKPISQSDLVLDADLALSLIAGGGVGAARIGLSDDNRRIFFSTKQMLSQSDINSLQRAIEQGRVELGHRLFKMPTYPVLVIKPMILDNPSNPFWLEVFPNIGGSDKAILEQIRRGDNLGICFHFYDRNGNVLFRAGYECTFIDQELGREVVEAEKYLDSLPLSARNYNVAAQQVIRENP